MVLNTRVLKKYNWFIGPSGPYRVCIPGIFHPVLCQPICKFKVHFLANASKKTQLFSFLKRIAFFWYALNLLRLSHVYAQKIYKAYQILAALKICDTQKTQWNFFVTFLIFFGKIGITRDSWPQKRRLSKKAFYLHFYRPILLPLLTGSLLMRMLHDTLNQHWFLALYFRFKIAGN